VDGEDVLGEVRLRTSSGHSHSVMPAVAFVLEALGLGALDVEGYAVASGPGSFTGLRIGIRTVQGWPSRGDGLRAWRPRILAARLRGLAYLVSMIVPTATGVRGRLRRRGPPAGAGGRNPAALVASLPEVAAFSGTARSAAGEICARPAGGFPGAACTWQDAGPARGPRLRGEGRSPPGCGRCTAPRIRPPVDDRPLFLEASERTRRPLGGRRPRTWTLRHFRGAWRQERSRSCEAPSRDPRRESSPATSRRSSRTAPSATSRSGRRAPGPRRAPAQDRSHRGGRGACTALLELRGNRA
jgi:hypothetical protein